MLRTLAKLFERKSTVARPDPWLRDALGAPESWAGPTVTAESAMQSSAVAACVRLLSRAWRVCRCSSTGATATTRPKRRTIRSTPYLHDAPNDYQTAFTWRAQMMTHTLLHGNAYSLIDRDDSGRVRALWPLLPGQRERAIH
jgi:phage portal protein BeeE